MALYTRFNSSRPSRPAGFKIVNTSRMIADKAGKYTDFTGFVSWHGSECTVSDASFLM